MGQHIYKNIDSSYREREKDGKEGGRRKEGGGEYLLRSLENLALGESLLRSFEVWCLCWLTGGQLCYL